MDASIVDAVSGVGTLVVAFVLLVSAAGKAVLPREERVEAALALGVPTSLGRPVAALLPAIEAGAAGALLWSRTHRGGAIAAAALLLAFTILLAGNLLRGRRPACNCFGSSGATPISWWSVLRNLGLLALAALAAVRPHGLFLLTDRVDSLDSARTWMGASAAVILLLLAAVIAAYRRTVAPAAPQHQEGGLPVGSTAPAFEVADLAGARVTLPGLLEPGLATMLVFTDPSCTPCKALLPELADWQRHLEPELRIAVLSTGGVDENRDKAEDLGLSGVLLQEADEVARAYRSPGTPSAVIVSASGRILSPTVAGAAAIRQLVSEQIGRTEIVGPQSEAPPLGDEAPLFEFEGVDGRPVGLLAHRGQLTIVLFWDPGCSFCQQVRPDLLRWERDHSGPQAPRLLVLSKGSATELRRQGFLSPAAATDDALLRRAYGATGTPQAIMVDANGLVASPLVSGRDDVLGLLRRAERLMAAASARVLVPPSATAAGESV